MERKPYHNWIVSLYEERVGWWFFRAMKRNEAGFGPPHGPYASIEEAGFALQDYIGAN